MMAEEKIAGGMPGAGIQNARPSDDIDDAPPSSQDVVNRKEATGEAAPSPGSDNK